MRVYRAGKESLHHQTLLPCFGHMWWRNFMLLSETAVRDYVSPSLPPLVFYMSKMLSHGHIGLRWHSNMSYFILCPHTMTKNMCNLASVPENFFFFWCASLSPVVFCESFCVILFFELQEKKYFNRGWTYLWNFVRFPPRKRSKGRFEHYQCRTFKCVKTSSSFFLICSWVLRTSTIPQGCPSFHSLL